MRQRRARGEGWGLATIMALTLVVGCDELGNPPLDRTLPASWTAPLAPGLELVTSSRSLEGARVREELAAAELDHAEPIDPGAWGTVVEVRLRVARGASPPRALRLQTDLVHADGERRVFTWPPLAPAPTYLAAFPASSPPVRVVTRLVGDP